MLPRTHRDGTRHVICRGPRRKHIARNLDLHLPEPCSEFDEGKSIWDKKNS